MDMLESFATAPFTCSERGGSEKFKMKIYVSSGIRTHITPVHDRTVSALGHEGLMVISGLMSYMIMGYKFKKKLDYGYMSDLTFISYFIVDFS